MNKIVIVGHPQSSFEKIEELLKTCGMASARPSRREGFSPQEISEILCREHNIPATPGFDGGLDSIRQIEPGPVWHGMALDLLLGNLDQPLWGWADPRSVYLLDYWKALDPKIAFVLVYSSPDSGLLHLTQNDPQSRLAGAVQQYMDSWNAYNSALLNFYRMNSDRCVLVHAGQVTHSANGYLQQMRNRVGVSLQLPVMLENDSNERPFGAFQTRVRGKQSRQMKLRRLQKTRSARSFDRHIEREKRPDMPTEASAELITSAANTDILVSPENVLQGYLAKSLSSHYTEAWQTYDQIQAAANVPLGNGDYSSYSALDAWQAMLAIRRQADAKNQAIGEYASRLDKLSHEIEQFKDSHLSAVEHSREVDVLNRQLRKQYDDMQAAKAQVDARIENLVEAAVSLETENRLLLAQLHKTLAELSEKAVECGAVAERFELAEVRMQRAEAQARQAEVQIQQAELRVQQAEKDREDLLRKMRKLSKMVTANEQNHEKNSIIDKENKLLLAQVHALHRELEQRQTRISAAFVGAAERVKSELPYILGATIIAHAGSLRGWATMLGALRLQRVKYAESVKGAIDLPPLENYQDAHEGERLKQHLSYRLGVSYLQNSSSLGGWLKMPWALRRAVKEFRSYRAGNYAARV